MGQMGSRAKGYCISILSALVCASTFISIKYSLGNMDTVAFTVVWFGSAAVYSLILSILRRDVRSLRIPRGYECKVVIAGACGAIAALPTFIAIKMLDPTVASLFARMEMVFLLVMGVVFLRERFSVFEGVGLAIAVAGILVTNWTTEPIAWVGFLLLAIAGLTMATQSTITKACVNVVGPQAMTFYRSVSVAVTMVVYMAVTGHLSLLANLHKDALLSALIGAFLGPFLGTILYYESMKHIDVTKTTAVAQVTPVFVAILSLVILHVFPGPRELTGGAILVGGLTLLVMAGVRRSADS